MITVHAAIKTKNPNNGSQGFTKGGCMARAAIKKQQRQATKLVCLAAIHASKRMPQFPVVVTITRIAPSNGLDPHDGLGAALKGVIDGAADALGLTNDRDPRVVWKLDQHRGCDYGVRITIEAA